MDTHPLLDVGGHVSRKPDPDSRGLPSEEILSFLDRMTEATKQQTKHTRYNHLTAFFNFIRNHVDENFRNPCDTPMMKRLFRKRGLVRWNTIEKDMIDQIIFKTPEPRNQLILELMARGGMRIGEVLKLTPNDVNDRKLTLREPKSGKEQEFVFIPQKVAERLKDYLKENPILPERRIFPICYEAARAVVRKAGKIVGIHLRPHDLRRHAATHASRSGVLVEIVSKVILRHANLSTKQRYPGKVSDTEAIKWIDNRGIGNPKYPNCEPIRLCNNGSVSNHQMVALSQKIWQMDLRPHGWQFPLQCVVRFKRDWF